MSRSMATLATPQIHPKVDDHGRPVQIHHPNRLQTAGFVDPSRPLTVVPGVVLPVAELNGVPFRHWSPPRDAHGWREVAGQLVIVDEPALVPGQRGHKLAAGLVILEPDGRIWLVSPTNRFGGYATTFPKGRIDPGLSYQANAIREAWEESGLKARIVAFLGDVDRTTTRTRYYLARREGGTPVDMGWESQAVHLVSLAQARALLNSPFDHQVIDLVEKVFMDNSRPMSDPW